MARLVLLAVVVIILVIIGLSYATKAYLQRQRQKQIARYAPRLLGHHGVPEPVAAMVVEQAEQLEEAVRIMNETLHDEGDYYAHANDMEAWLEKHKTIQRRLSL